VSKQQTLLLLTLFKHGCSHYQGSSFPHAGRTGLGKWRADSDDA